MAREPMLYVAVGQKGIGKSTATAEKLRQYRDGNPAAGQKGRKGLVFDAQHEYSDPVKYPDFKGLALNQIGLYTVHPTIEIRRVSPFKPNGAEMTPDEKAMAVLHILQNYRNGSLLLEDINNYIGDHLPHDVVGTILSQRHKGVDMLLHYHSLGRIQKKIWPHINWIRMHKCNDSVVDNKDKFPDKFECFKIAENIVSEQFTNGNKWFYLHIDFVNQKIIAEITDQERDKAIEDYLMQNNARLITPYTKMKDSTGKGLYNYASAFQKEKLRCITAYFTAS